MKRHSLSILVSLLFHTVLVVLLFLSYKYIYPKFTTQQETRVCIKLNCLSSQKSENISTKKVEKQELKPVEKVKKVKKIIEKKKIKPEIKKKVKILKEIPVQKMSEEKEILKEKSKAEIVVKPSIAQAEKEVTQNSVEISLQQESEKTDEELYVEENLNLIVQLLQENLYYPRRARKRGVEGDVLVRFNLSTEAQLSNVEVISSVSDILSRGALQTIENIASELPKPKTNLTLSVPISYRLH